MSGFYRAMPGMVIVSKLEESNVTSSGIALLSSQDSTRRAKVLSVGHHKSGSQAPPSVEEGDIILYDKAYGTDISKSDNLMVLHEQDILAIVTLEQKP